MKCSHCGKEIEICDKCGVHFYIGEELYCDNDKNHASHLCKECKIINIKWGKVIK